MSDAEIGVFGGSGFYSLLDNAREVTVETPYGSPSAPLTIGSVEGRSVAFLPRHGREHELPPHMINYRANVWAMREVGARWVLGPCASGSLQRRVGVGDFVVCDQFVDRTSARKDTFYDGPEATHISSADPFSPALRDLLISTCEELGITVHRTGTVVVVQGPRLSTRAESRWFGEMGWEVVNMTAYPECILARELELCYANVSLITDYDVGVAGEGIEPASASEILEVFTNNNQRLRELILAVIPRIPKDPDPHCAEALTGARF